MKETSEGTRSKVMVLVQGENSEGQVCDVTLDGEFAMIFVATDEGIRTRAFGSLNGPMACTLQNALNTTVSDLRDEFPQIALLEALEALEDKFGDVLQEDYEEDE